MKKTILAIAVVLAPVLMSAQAQINTKKVKIEDFTETPLKVVLTGNVFYDQVLMEEMQNRWRISPFEFCTLEEFGELKEDDSYYFMLTVTGKFRKESEPGLSMLSVVKGGKGAGKGINHMLEVVTLPVMSARFSSGREFVFMPAFLDIIQKHIILSMENDLAGYSGIGFNSSNMTSTGSKSIILAEEDLSSDITENDRKAYFRYRISSAPADTVDEIMMDSRPNTLVSFTVAPFDGENGSYCYKMLIDAETHELYYYRRHRISKRFGPGFLLEDLERIAAICNPAIR